MSTTEALEGQEISVNVKCTTGQKFTVKSNKEKTIREVKELCSEESKVPADSQRLIYKGHVLNDSSTLDKVGFQDGNTLILVKSVVATSKPSASTTAQSQPQAEQPQQPQAQPSVDASTTATEAATGAANPFNLFSQMGAGGLGNQADPTASVNEMLRNPDMIMQMMQNPMVQQMMNSVMQNPAMLQQMMQSNPMLQQMTNGNPQLQAQLQNLMANPQLMQMAMNPQNIQAMMQMQQMFQNQNTAQTQPQQAPTTTPQTGNNTTTQQTANATSTTPNTASTNPQQPQSQAQPQQPLPNIDFSQFAQMLQNFNVPSQQQTQPASTGTNTQPQATNPVNPFAFLMGQQPVAQPPSQPSMNPVQLEELYKEQLSVLESMGFVDRQKNIQALVNNGGDVERAIEELITR